VPPIVGFDLDMTLIDARPGMARVIDQMARETGLPLDGAYFAAHLGPPLDLSFRNFGVPEALIPGLVERYRELYPDIVVPSTVPLPGAAEAITAVRAAGGRSIVVTAKIRKHALLHLDILGWPVDEVVGGLWAEGKGEALRERHATIYVGDHIGDMIGARTAAAVGVGVLTGPCDEQELRDAGAEVILPDLTVFPAWLAGSVSA
jgi:phosphoglycolate phosphatase